MSPAAATQIKALNYGAGALKVTADGTVEGAALYGIHARNVNGADLTITTGQYSDVTGGNVGIFL